VTEYDFEETKSGGGILDNMAHEGLWEQLDKLDPQETAIRLAAGI